MIPAGMHILELGESQLLPAESGEALLSALADFVTPDRVLEAERRLAIARQSKSQYLKVFGPARALYHAIFDPASYVAVDLEQGPRRYCLDLNGTVNLGIHFDCVINNGTSEHLFDQANVFRTIHEHTRAGGLMIHFTPCLGWLNHGLYHVQPGFFFDLAAANQYDAKFIGLATDDKCYALQSPQDVPAALREYPKLHDSELCAVLQKINDEPFSVPLQGAYGFQVSALHLARIPRRTTAQVRRNLALNRPSLQSSTSYWSWHDDPALDAAGGNNGRVNGYYSFCTELVFEPWWMVDLGGPLSITEVVVHNRLDHEPYARRAAHLIILLSDDCENWRQVYSRPEDTAFGGADGKPLRVALAPQTTRYLRIMLPEATLLHLDEIEVY
jgi:F5/8 type C domain